MSCAYPLHWKSATVFCTGILVGSITNCCVPVPWGTADQKELDGLLKWECRVRCLRTCGACSSAERDTVVV